VVEIMMEIKTGLHDVVREIGRLGGEIKDNEVNMLKEFKATHASQANNASDHRDLNLSGLQSTLDALPKKLEAVFANRSVPAATPAPSTAAQHSVTKIDLQEALALQKAVILQTRLAFSGIYAARLPFVSVGHMMPEIIPAATVPATALPIAQMMPEADERDPHLELVVPLPEEGEEVLDANPTPAPARFGVRVMPDELLKAIREGMH
jgi:hypothetical protein